MAKCILHIGMHKTGTTSIQRSLANLDDANFYYARIGGSPGHSVPVCSVFAEKKNARHLVESRSRSSGTPKEKIAAARHDLKESIKTANGRTLVISGEGLVRLKLSEIIRMRRFLAHKGYEDVEVVAYIRPPASYVASAWLYRKKLGGLNAGSIETLVPAYKQKFSKFDRVFGRDKVRLFKFDQKSFEKKDVVLDLCHRTGIPEASIKLIRKNESISKTTMQLIYRYRMDAKDQGLPPLHTALVEELNMHLDGEGVPNARVSPKILRPILERLQDDIDWMEQRLGQSLYEDLGEERETDIRSEADLLEPVPGINEKLAGLLTNLGVAHTEKDAADTNTLLRLYRQHSVRQMRNGRDATKTGVKRRAPRKAGPGTRPENSTTET